MNTKKCNKCGQTKPTDQYHKASKNKGGLFHTCKLCRQIDDRQRYQDFRELRRQQIQEYKEQTKALVNAYKKSKGCLLCDEDEPIALDFHHLEDKDDNIANMSSWSKMQKEIAKCVVLCANCHRKVHAGILGLPSGSGAESTKLG